MTTFRCERVLLAALIVLGACGQTNSEKHPPDSRDIKHLVQSADAQAIEQELPPLLAKIQASNGSIGAELVRAGFAPAPEIRQIYGYDRADGTSVGVTVRGEQIEVRVKQEPPK